MRQFVPMTDELLYDAANLPGPLVPYQCGVPCWHALQVESQRVTPAAQMPAPVRADDLRVSASPSADHRV